MCRYVIIVFLLHFIFILCFFFFFFFKQKTAYEMRISDWSSDVCSSDLNCSKILKHIKMTAPINPAMTQLSIKQARSTRLLLRQQNFRAQVERHRRRPSRKCHPSSPLRIHPLDDRASPSQTPNGSLAFGLRAYHLPSHPTRHNMRTSPTQAP